MLVSRSGILHVLAGGLCRCPTVGRHCCRFVGLFVGILSWWETGCVSITSLRPGLWSYAFPIALTPTHLSSQCTFFEPASGQQLSLCLSCCHRLSPFLLFLLTRVVITDTRTSTHTRARTDTHMHMNRKNIEKIPFRTSTQPAAHELAQKHMWEGRRRLWRGEGDGCHCCTTGRSRFCSW